MCLAVPGKVLHTYEDRGTPMATLGFDGVRKEVCVALVPDVVVGEYAVVHAGVAIAKLDEASALETLRILASIDFDDEMPVDSIEGAAQ